MDQEEAKKLLKEIMGVDNAKQKILEQCARQMKIDNDYREKSDNKPNTDTRDLAIALAFIFIGLPTIALVFSTLFALVKKIL